MEITPPLQNDHLPANHQDAGDIKGDLPVENPFGLPEGPAPIELIETANVGWKAGESPPPVTKKEDLVERFTFPEVIYELVQGQKITRLAWEDMNSYVVLWDGVLHIHKPDETFLANHVWAISTADLIGKDWVIV